MLEQGSYARPALRGFVWRWLSGSRDAFNQGDREPQLAAKFGFAGSHLSFVGLVIEAVEVQQAVKQKDADLIAQAVAVGSGLACSCLE